jgi:hypothetical protein
MLKNIILKQLIPFLILLIGFILLFHYTQQITEKFFDVPVTLQTFAKDMNLKTNDLTSLIDLTNNTVIGSPEQTQKLQQAINGIDAVPSAKLFDLVPSQLYQIPSGTPETLQQASSCEAAPKTCAAFDDPTFASQCGISFDLNGTGSSGQAHMGGLYVSSYDRKSQTDRATDVSQNHSAPYDPYQVYQPSIGKASLGKFALTKDQCVVVKEKVDCEARQSFTSPNCTQCFTSQSFSRVGPETARIPFILHLAGNGLVTIVSADNSISLAQKQLSANDPINVQIPANSEGKGFDIIFFPNPNTTQPPHYLSGFIEGQTARNPFKVDLNTMIQWDKVTNQRPRMAGTKTVSGFRCLSFVPGTGKDRMILSCLVPFSFLNVYDMGLVGCENGPVITQAASATFLESDPCFGKANQPGNYKLECLQSRWIALGGDMNGTGYPSTQAKADAIQKDTMGRALNIDEIMDQLSLRISRGQLGVDAAGNALSIADWNTDSMWAFGLSINTPCDGQNASTGPLSKTCLTYLYRNQGANSRIGATYTMNAGQHATLKGEGFEDQVIGTQFNQPDTTADPTTARGLQIGQTLGGVQSTKNAYDQVNRRANDDSLSNKDRSNAIEASYGVQVLPSSANTIIGAPQVFAVGPGYQYTRGEAPAVCAKYGASVATTAQLEEAQKNGADWCFSGWVTEGTGKWPITTSAVNGCGGRQGIIEWTPGDKAGVNCYGPKPDITTVKQGEILPFNGDSWEQSRPHEDPIYATVRGGYLETTGPQPACFNGLSSEQAKANCNALGPMCAGISYSIDGSGNGCYKGNVSGGKNGNGAYKGFVKIPNPMFSTVKGRYIKFQYNHVDCLNLAQIEVYGSNGGPNLITPNTTVVKPDGYQGDMYPNRNFVDGVGNTFVHTSCNNIPWIMVDMGSMIPMYKIVLRNRKDCCQSRVLGTVMTIMNDQNQVIYQSNPIQSTVMTYTYYPPKPNIQYS